MILTGENRSSGEITCPSATLSINILKWTGPESNPVHRTVNHFQTRSVWQQDGTHCYRCVKLFGEADAVSTNI